MTPPIHAATILQIIPRLDTGGAELATLEIAEAVNQAGGRCFVLTEGGRLASEAERVGAIVVPFAAGSKNPVRMLQNAMSLTRFVRERGVDLLHARSRAPAWSALLAARQTGVPFVTTYHGAYGNQGPLKPQYNSVMARGDLVIANSGFTAELVHQRHATPMEKIRVIQRGVDLDAFDPAVIGGDRISRVRKGWGARPGDKIILHAARLTGWKGQRHVIDAAAALMADGEYGDVLFVLAGDAQGRESYRAELQAQIAAYGLQDKVKLPGHCADMAAAFAAAHVAVVASTEPEAFGRASVEAQAVGCPVIVTEQGASPETLLLAERDGVGQATGWMVPPGDARALAGVLAKALKQSPLERESMGRRARLHVAQNFSARQMKLKTLQVYDELLRSALATAFEDAQEN